MHFNDYQDFTNTTAIYKDSIEKYVDSLGIENKEKKEELKKILNLTYSILGLTNEAGEVAGKLKKIIRDKECNLSESDCVSISDEIGDTNYYQAQVLENLNYRSDYIIKRNIQKLESRKERGVLKGSGDNR